MKFILLLKCVHFAVCKLYFNKVLLKKWTVFDKEARVGNRRCLMLLLYIYAFSNPCCANSLKNLIAPQESCVPFPSPNL